MLYIVDISEQCGYTIAQQAALFHSIRPLFSNKPLLIVANKTDAIRPEALPDADKAILAEMGRAAAQASNPGAALCPMLGLCSRWGRSGQPGCKLRTSPRWSQRLWAVSSAARALAGVHAIASAGVFPQYVGQLVWHPGS